MIKILCLCMTVYYVCMCRKSLFSDTSTTLILTKYVISINLSLLTLANRIVNEPNRNIDDEVTRTFKHTDYKDTENRERKSIQKNKREFYKARLPRSPYPDYEYDYVNEPESPTTTTTKKPEEKPKESELSIWIRSFFKNWRKFSQGCHYFWNVSSKLYWKAIQREIRNLGPLLKWMPKKKFLEDYYNKEFTWQPKPEAEAAITKGLGLVIRQVYGIELTKYDDNLIPKYKIQLKPIKIN